MSFALEYRKKLQDRERRQRALKKANEGFVTMPLDEDADTRGNRRRVMLALVVAGLLLATLNSAGLVSYTRDMYETQLGRTLIVASEKWHAMMERGKATLLVDSVRGTVSAMRETSWRDLRVVFDLAPVTQPAPAPDEAPVLPASSPELPVEPEMQETVRPQPHKPAGPVMRASADAVEPLSR